MNLLLVTFSLRNPNKDYSPFFAALRGNALQWCHFVEQTWVLTTFHDAEKFARLLYPHMEIADSLLVLRLPPHGFQGWLPKAAWDWLNAVSDKIGRSYVPDVLPQPSNR